MRYIDEFRNGKLIAKAAGEIRRAAAGRRLRIMEVCGTHTTAIFRFGLRELLPLDIELLSGPGCPVCVTPNSYLDRAIALARMKDVTIATFGDMLRVPGSHTSLAKERAAGADIRIVASSIDALALARRYPSRQIVFLGVGFETTIPTVAQSIVLARRAGIANYSVLCGHKTMPEILAVLAHDPALNVDAFMLPGHVSAIIGMRPYAFLPRRYGKPCVVAGFEPLDILQAVLMLVGQRRPVVALQYTRVIAAGGNRLARAAIDRVFRPVTGVWRGLGAVRGSGLAIRRDYAAFDAERKFRPAVERPKEERGCICGDVLKGIRTPSACRLFGKVCTPAHPVGACMVSSEGTCSAYYRYEKR